jgi:iron(III) transport system substrate-binding protein
MKRIRAMSRMVLALLAMVAAGCNRSAERPEVVVYVAHDKVFSEAILQRFMAETGIVVRAKYDVESTKTIGLVNAIREEAAAGRTRCDVFWNNEPMNTLRLKGEGLLEPFAAPNGRRIPDVFKDPEGYWTGFAGRVRVIIVNTELVGEADRPDSIEDLTDPRWKGKVGIAKPLFGTTATHMAYLWAGLGPEKARGWLAALKANEVVVCAGNRDCARLVGSGRLAMALTDTDDALSEAAEGSPVAFVYPDGGPDQMGTVFLPNTVAIVRGAPHPRAAREMVNYLLSLRTECALAESGSGQVPLREDAHCRAAVKGPRELREMEVGLGAVAAAFEPAMAYVESEFLK